MSRTFSLLWQTPADWVNVALSDFDAFLLDHAACERKASAVGLSFVVRYPDKPQLIEPMIQFAREELEHFHQVVKLCLSRGLTLERDREDDYANLLLRHVRDGRDERFLDRLLVSSVIEARGHERLSLVATALQDTQLRSFYERLARAEGHHQDFFMEMAHLFFPNEAIQRRLDEFLTIEQAVMASLPYRAALH